jgi:nucleoid DNA-binding protein
MFRKQDLVSMVSKKNDLSIQASSGVVDSVLSSIFELSTQADSEGLNLVGFGKFETLVSPARKSRNPKTGESVIAAPRRRVKFRMSNNMKEAANAVLHPKTETAE